jgi:hypothetical protein
MSVYALNLFDLAANDDYLAYQRALRDLDRYGANVKAVGSLSDDGALVGDSQPRQVMILVEWPSREMFDAFVAGPENAAHGHLRENGTKRYLWWLYDRLEDVRPLFAHRSS